MRPRYKPWLPEMSSRILFPHDQKPIQSYSVAEVAARYGFPKPTKPASQAVGILSLGGGFSPKDVATYCAHNNIPTPPYSFVGVQGAVNHFTGDPHGPDGELALDMQMVLGATGGLVPIIVYGAPNTEDGYGAGLTAIALQNLCCAATSSWGLAEMGWAASGRQLVDDALQQLLKKAVPTFVASGDDGSRDGQPGNNADYPASSPYAIACGGTTLAPQGETAWSYGGGGYSAFYAKPSFQMGTLPASQNRGLPDVAGNADPNTGYAICLNGQWGIVGGTSAVAPLWAAAIALAVALKGTRLAQLLPWLYAKNILTDIPSGSNGGFQARKGWDECTGLGVPNKAFFDAIQAATTPEPLPQPPVVQPPPVPVKHGEPVAGTLVDAAGQVTHKLLVAAV